MNLVKPLTVIFGTLISYLLLSSIDFKKKSNEPIPEKPNKMKDILNKVSLFIALFIVFIALVYLFNITSLFDLSKLSALCYSITGGFKKNPVNVSSNINDNVSAVKPYFDETEMQQIPIEKLQQTYAEIETIKRIRENIEVGLSPDSMSIGEISRK